MDAKPVEEELAGDAAAAAAAHAAVAASRGDVGAREDAARSSDPAAAPVCWPADVREAETGPAARGSGPRAEPAPAAAEPGGPLFGGDGTGSRGAAEVRAGAG
jgi:hypothetical protein